MIWHLIERQEVGGTLASMSISEQIAALAMALEEHAGGLTEVEADSQLHAEIRGLGVLDPTVVREASAVLAAMSQTFDDESPDEVELRTHIGRVLFGDALPTPQD